jgi:predicted TIM-barrel fold metal-dependent hydrolase
MPRLALEVNVVGTLRVAMRLSTNVEAGDERKIVVLLMRDDIANLELRTRGTSCTSTVPSSNSERRRQVDFNRGAAASSSLAYVRAMPKPMHATKHLTHAGAVDADGHILEPPDLWETYLEPDYRDRALRIVRDENGLEELAIGGAGSQMSRKGFPATLGAMGAPDFAAMARDPDRTYVGEAPYGSMDPDERLHVLDAEGIDAVVLYTTIGLLWEAELEDPALSQAYTRAYNRWICEFCADSPRLVPTAHLSLSDPRAAARELERAVGDGARGAYVAPFTHDGRPLGHPSNHCVFAAAQDLDVPFAIHPTFEPQWTKGARMGTWEHVKQLRLLASVTASDGVRQQFTTLFDYGVFDLFPRLRVVVLESGGGWIGYWPDRIDAVYGHTVIGTRVPLADKPSDYFRERVWISCDPDERTIPALVERFGDRFMWASDFPHADHTPNYIDDLDELARAFPEQSRRQFLGGNARDLFRIQQPSPA